MKKPIDLIIENAKNFYLDKKFSEEKSCYRKIYKAYYNNKAVLQKLLLLLITLQCTSFEINLRFLFLNKAPCKRPVSISI